jgi:hypothetical protein
MVSILLVFDVEEIRDAIGKMRVGRLRKAAA